MTPIPTGILILIAFLELSFSIPGSSAQSSCPAHAPCLPASKYVICRADHYYWKTLPQKDGLVETPAPGSLLTAMQINQRYQQATVGDMHLAQFRSKDGTMHFSTIKMTDTKLMFTNNGDIVGDVEVLCNFMYGSAPRFKWLTMWPGTMQSRRIDGSPDMREAAIIVGVENNQFTYLGLPLVNKDEPYRSSALPLYGRIIQDGYGNYELLYRDVDDVYQRTEHYRTLVHKKCADAIERNPYGLRDKPQHWDS